MTTNGVTLSRNLDQLKANGLDSVNISIDTLSSQLFNKITNRPALPLVLKSIEKCLEEKFEVKLNVVVMQSNKNTLVDFIEFGRARNLKVRFIEYMPFSGNQWDKANMVGYNEMMQLVSERYPDIYRIYTEKHDTTKVSQNKSRYMKY